jgi:hypothetical protein
MQTVPYPVYSTPEQSAYNLKLGRMLARFHAGAQIEYNDNINLSATDPRSDLSMGPRLDVGFMLPVSKENLLQLDMGIGYRWYLNSPAINSFSLAPRSRLDYRAFLGNVHLDFYDSFAIQTDPVTRPEISGGPNRLINFQRFLNTSGLIAEWRPYRRWGFVGGYSYTIDRSLTSDFLFLDHEAHNFSAGTYHLVSSKLTIGGNASYSLSTYRDSYQNDGAAFTVGPFVSWQMTRFLSLDASVGYTVSSFEDRGLLGDRSDFQGFSFQIGLRHRINSRTSQNLRFGRSVGLGFGSNFTETYSLQHGFTMQLNRAMSVNSLFSYENYSASNIGGESGSRFLYYIGIGYQMSRRWHAMLGYSFAWKDSALAGRDYTQNRVVVELQRRF